MPNLQVVDPHIHLWDLSTKLYPGLEKPSTGFGGDNTAIAKSYLLPDLLADVGGVEILKAVHVEAFPTDALAEARHVQSMADAAGNNAIPQGIVAYANLADKDAGRLLAQLSEVPNVRGIRQVINRHPNPLFNYVQRDFLDEPAWHSGFALLSRYQLSFDLQLYPHQMAQAARLAAAHSETPIVVNHAGMWADRAPAGWRQWRDGMRLLAREPNVSVKISGLVMFDHQWTLDSLRPLVFETLDAFGTERVMFASNFPVDKLHATYAALWHAYAGMIGDLPPDEQVRLLRGNAERFYRI